MKKVYICAPLGGDIQGNLEKAKRYTEYALKCGTAPVVPHFYALCLNDDIPSEREIGLSAGMSLFDLHPEMLSGDSAETTAPAQEQPQEPVSGKSGKQPLSKDEFVKAVSEYSAKAISVPKILVQTTSEVKFNRFEVQ